MCSAAQRLDGDTRDGDGYAAVVCSTRGRETERDEGGEKKREGILAQWRTRARACVLEHTCARFRQAGDRGRGELEKERAVLFSFLE